MKNSNYKNKKRSNSKNNNYKKKNTSPNKAKNNNINKTKSNINKVIKENVNNSKLNKKIILIILLSIISIILLITYAHKYYIRFDIKDKYIKVSVNENVNLPVVKAYFMNKDISKNINQKSNIDSNKIGTYYVTYKVKYLIFSKKQTIKVKVVDEIAPTLTLKGNDVVTICPKSKYEEEGYEVSDNYDTDLTSKVEIKEYEDYNEYVVMDSSKNITKVTRKIIKEDKISPNLTIKGNSSYSVKLNGTFNVPSYEVNDNCDTNLKVEVTNSVDTKKEGTYKVTYKVKDESDNETIKEISVKVYNPSTRSNDYSNIVMGPVYINGILIVNKKYALPASYGSGVDSTAYSALQKLQKAAKDAGYSIPLLSGYRSYNTQKSLYNSYVKRDGVKLADTYSARPGHSEHQTGLAFDIGKIDNNYGNTKEGRWLSENAHKYGFIIRYPKGKESITGYQYEPWHVRYVGESHAQIIYSKNLTLEEYLGV